MDDSLIEQKISLREEEMAKSEYQEQFDLMMGNAKKNLEELIKGVSK